MDMAMWQSAEIDKLTAAIVKAQARLKPVPKKCTNSFFHSKYADLADVMEGLAPFNEEGIAITQFPMEAPQGQLYLDTQLSLGNQWMRSRLTMTLAKNDPQGMGSAITYGRRYALGCMTGVVTDEDNDGNVPKPVMPAVLKSAMSQPAPPPYKNAPENGPETAAPPGSSCVPPQAQDGSGAPNLKPIFQPDHDWFKWRIGKWKGTDITEIDSDYLIWFRDNGKLADHVDAARMELDRRNAQEEMEMEAE